MSKKKEVKKVAPAVATKTTPMPKANATKVVSKAAPKKGASKKK